MAILPLAVLLATAWNAVGQGVKKSLAVAVCGPSPFSVTATPAVISQGQSTTIAWSFQGTATLDVPAGVYWEGDRSLSGNGSRVLNSIPAGTHEILIRAKDSCDNYLESFTSVRVVPLPNVYFSPANAYPNTGQAVQLNWHCASNCEGGVVSSAGLPSSPGVSGSISPSRGSDGMESYSITVKNAIGGEKTASAWIQWSTPQPDYGDMDCFASGTQITMADGSKKNVEDLQVGDAVRSYDAKTGQFATVKVLSAATKAGGDYVKINGGKGVTLDHRIFANGEWKRAGDLKVGDELIDETGKPIKITAIESKPGPVTVHPIKVEDPPSTFIAEGIVVHNRDEAEAKNEGLLAGTKVTMADGRRLPIEKVKAGDKVLSIDPKTGMLQSYRVRSTAVETASEYSIINGTLRMGGGHRLLRAKPRKGQAQGDKP
ncbi:MAG: hypothetical protein HY554_13920 [Elusimicrobia bacterium]|nr:hypothetical protein [Elusimicrobiota bacterium]